MTDEAPPAAEPTAPTPAPVPRSRKGLWIGLAAGGMVLTFILGGIVGAVGGAAVAGGLAARGGAPAAAAATPSTVVSDDAPTTDESEAPTFSYEDQSPTLSLKTTGKQCFGSAGCNVTVKVVLAIDDPATVPDDATGSVTYSIKGGDDGEVIGTVDITGSQYTADEQVVTTSSSSKKLSVEITDVTTNP